MFIFNVAYYCTSRILLLYLYYCIIVLRAAVRALLSALLSCSLILFMCYMYILFWTNKMMMMMRCGWHRWRQVAAEESYHWRQHVVRVWWSSSSMMLMANKQYRTTVSIYWPCCWSSQCTGDITWQRLVTSLTLPLCGYRFVTYHHHHRHNGSSCWIASVVIAIVIVMIAAIKELVKLRQRGESIRSADDKGKGTAPHREKLTSEALRCGSQSFYTANIPYLSSSRKRSSSRRHHCTVIAAYCRQSVTRGQATGLLRRQNDVVMSLMLCADVVCCCKAYALRALRFLFSVERNRRHFKRMFPADLFEAFIDIGHYNRDINAYMSLVNRLNTLPVWLSLSLSVCVCVCVC